MIQLMAAERDEGDFDLRLKSTISDSEKLQQPRVHR